MGDTVARSKTVPATLEIVTSAIAADLIRGELEEWRAALERQAHEQNASLLVKRRLRALDSTVRQLTELHELDT